MKKILLSFSSLLIILIGSFCSPRVSLASTLQWVQTYSHLGVSGSIKVAETDNSIVYAAVAKDGIFDILKSIDSGQSWFSVKGNLPTGNDINWISVYKQDPNIVAVSLWQGGVFLTQDSGINWLRIFNSATPRSVEINPTDSSTIYIGIGGNHDNSSGVYKSTDKGNSWTKLLPLNNNNAEIVIDKNNPDRIFADSDPYFYRSLDGGVNWTLLTLSRAYANSVIDNSDQNVIYSQQFDTNTGLYKSINNGDSWVLKNSNIKYFHLAQDDDGVLYASMVNSTGGVWRSTDGAEHWENVGDPAWGTANTWGLDARGGRVYVSVEGLGLFVADASSSATPPPPPPPPPPGPSPVVVVPGFGGSFSTKEFVLHQNSTDYHDWVMMPVKAPELYNPFLNAAQTSFYLQDHKVFFFAYDFTKSVSETAYWLNDYLQNEVLNHNPQGTKVSIVAHSMGGLVARYCFELVAGCRDKINQIVSAGTPHKGAVDDYFLWEGADFKNLDTMTTYGAKFLLHFYGLPKWNEVKLIQEKIAGARDFMPVFDYITNKPYDALSVVAKNPLLKSQLPLSDGFGQKTLALSGNRTNSTSEKMSVNPASKKETDAGYWIDGKPKTTTLGTGDGTVLTSSSNVPGAINKEFNVSHESYLNADGPFGEILKFLGLSPIGPLSTTVTTSSMIIYGDSQLLDISANGQKGEKLTKPSANVIFVVNPSKPIKRDVDVSSPIGGNFIVNGWYTDDSDYDLTSRPIKFSLFPGEKKKLNLQFK